MYRPFTDQERAELQKKLQYYYDLFLERVASSRGLKKEEVDSVGQGKVWTGEQAKAHQLVDEIGGLRQAIQSARHLAGLDVSSPIVQLPIPEDSLLGAVLGVPGVSAEQAALPVPKGLIDVARALAPFALHNADTPMMRLEFLPGALK
jgi:protease-4